jgi:hypothetical protein
VKGFPDYQILQTHSAASIWEKTGPNKARFVKAWLSSQSPLCPNGVTWGATNSHYQGDQKIKFFLSFFSFAWIGTTGHTAAAAAAAAATYRS